MGAQAILAHGAEVFVQKLAGRETVGQVHRPPAMMYPMSDLQYQAVYNVLSFSLASMMATTMYLWFRAFAVRDRYKSAVIISGLVTFIAAYHYIRIFNSWVDAYHYPSTGEMNIYIKNHDLGYKVDGHEVMGVHGYEPPYHI